MTGRSRWYSSFDPDRTASWASAAASRSSRPSPNATGDGTWPAAARTQPSCNRAAARAAGTSGSPAVRACATSWSAVRPSASAGSRRAGSVASRAILPSRRRAAICSSPASARFSAWARSRARRSNPAAIRAGGTESGVSAGGGSAARTAPASSSTVATPPTSASACLAVSAMASSRSRHPAWVAHPSCRAPTCWATRALVTVSSPASSFWLAKGSSPGSSPSSRRAVARRDAARAVPACARRSSAAATGSGSTLLSVPKAVRRSCPRPVTARPNLSRHCLARALTSRRVASATPDRRFSRTGSTATRSPTVATP